MQNTRQDYDPAKAHDYYERTKKLKGRTKAASPAPSAAKGAQKPKAPVNSKAQKAHDRIGRLKGKIKKLQAALSETEAELSKRRQSARKSAKESSDGKTTAKERQASQEYRDKHQEELKAKDKKDPPKSSSSSSSKSASDMDVKELEARATKIKSVLREAKRQLSVASQQLGQLAHSAITSEPNVNERFARFQSAERIPSK